MSGQESRFVLITRLLPLTLVSFTVPSAVGQLNLGSEELVQADAADIDVPGYSVPSFVHWDEDGLRDLVVGEGSGSYTAMVRVYLNVGTASAPQYSSYLYAQSDGADLTVPGSGCLGAFPLVVHWDGDGKKDLLVGQADGKVKLFLNVGTDDAPTFDGGTFLQVGPAGSKTDIVVGSRATLAVADWNNDAAKDLVVGDLGGKIHVFLNEGTDFSPDFVSDMLVQESGSDLVVPELRSSPVILDLDGDGKKDLLTGNTAGQLLLYSNVGTDEAPEFSGYSFVEADGVPIDLAGTPRSRPAVCDWTGDGLVDVLIGAGDGNVHLYQGVPPPGDFDGDGDVDQDDLDQFEDCYTGPDGGPVDPECEPGDFDGDGDIDCDDWEQFKEAWGNPGDPPPPPPPQIPCRSIPTVSTWGTITLMLLVLVAGIIIFRGRMERPAQG